MSRHCARDNPKAARQSATEKSRDEPAYAGRNNSDKRQRDSAPLRSEPEPEDDRPHGLGWLPVSLLGLVVLCLILAAWVWFEILWM